MTERTIPSGELSHIIDFIYVRSKLLIIQFGEQYSNKKVVVTISSDFKKFKKDIEKTLNNKHIIREDIQQIISLIESNYEIVYPDIENNDIAVESSNNDIKSLNSETKKPTTPTKIDITFEEWQPKLKEKYDAVRETCNKNFPGIWHSIEFDLSVLSILNIKGCTLPFAGIVLGPPSSSKTLGIELFREYSNTYYSDSFTPNAFVSHSSNVKKEELAEVDMLPKIKDKSLLVPELSSIFAKKDEEVIEALGIMTRVLDGHGYQSDSRVHGRRGYSGEYMFTMIGAAVEIPYRIHKHLSNLGPKLFFLRMPRSNKTDEDYIKMLHDDNFNEKKQELQEKINDYLNYFDKYSIIDLDNNNNNNNRQLKIPFDSKINQDEHNDILAIIVKLGKLLSHLRGSVNIWHTQKTQGSDYGYSTPIIEDPSRAMIQLKNLAKGHALSQGRNYLTFEDIPLLIKVVLSTASIERVMVFDLLLAHDGTITTSQLVKSLGISKLTALKTMNELKILGLVLGDHLDTAADEEEQEEYDYSLRYRNINNEKKSITLNKEFEWFLSKEFKDLREAFIPDGKSKYDDKIDKVAKEEESVKKNSPCALQKKLCEIEGEGERQIIAPQQQTNNSKPSSIVTQIPRQNPMLPLLRPILYLPDLQQRTTIKQDTKEGLSINIQNFKNSNNQDTLYEDAPPLINTKITTNSQFSLNNTGVLIQELV